MQGNREEQRRRFVRRVLKEYYDEDKTILIDSSICRVLCTKYIIGDLIYFGNKILIPSEELEIIKDFANCNQNVKWKIIRKRNAQIILGKIEKDTHKSIEIVDMPKAKEKVDGLENYLKENPSVLLYLQDNELYQKLQTRELRKQLFLMYEGMEDIGLFASKYKFETIGSIDFEKGKMKIYTNSRRTSEIKIFYDNGKIKEEEDGGVEVKPRDFIVIKSQFEEDGVKSIRLYEIVSKHSRNHASLILWTTLEKEQTTNWYIEQLPYKLQRIIMQ